MKGKMIQMHDIPSSEQCIHLLEKAGCSKKVINHCQAVRDVAVKIAQCTQADIKLVEAGALLHDIGRSNTHDIHHAIEGAHIAESYDLPNEIVRIIERHIGAGLSADTAASLGLPRKNYLPETLEEKIVCHADNLLDDCTRQPIEHEVEQALNDGKKEYAMQLVQLHHELSTLCGKDLNTI